MKNKENHIPIWEITYIFAICYKIEIINCIRLFGVAWVDWFC